jgi:hypothetical protein
LVASLSCRALLNREAQVHDRQASARAVRTILGAGLQLSDLEEDASQAEAVAPMAAANAKIEAGERRKPARRPQWDLEVVFRMVTRSNKPLDRRTTHGGLYAVRLYEVG